MASISSSAQLRGALSESICPHNPEMSESIEQLAGIVGKSPGLLVLDNFEQIAEDGAVVIRTLLERAPLCAVL